MKSANPKRIRNFAATVGPGVGLAVFVSLLAGKTSIFLKGEIATQNQRAS